ncbi:MAG: glycosyltransferase [Armatimonadota bacterium]|nr:glycosyltransferase [Armatimonadota bacterium]
MHIVMFYHSLLSDWNHGTAHFLRGVVSELLSKRHDVRVYEPENGSSLRNLTAEHGTGAIEGFHAAYPGLKSELYNLETLDLDSVLDGANLVIVHERNESELVARIGQQRARGGRFKLLFHDTSHRAVTDPASMAGYDLSNYDGVLAFGNMIRHTYLKRGWASRVWVWHEAADTRMFQPAHKRQRDGDLVWIGNWGDDERNAELHEFLLGPVEALGLNARVYGVGYPENALDALAKAGVNYAGWLPNYWASDVYSRYRVTVHVPRRPYARALPGVPSIRVFEALACGIPLVSAPWEDAENLFTPGKDFLVARNGDEMKRYLRELLEDDNRARGMALHGYLTVLSRHTCAHRVDELMDICKELALGAEVSGKGFPETTTTKRLRETTNTHPYNGVDRDAFGAYPAESVVG